MNEIECIRAFVKVVEVGSFAEAARQTGAAKSAIINRVNQLEEHLELQLLQRSTRKLTATDSGADFFEKSLHLLSELEHAKASASEVEWGLAGTFKVSCIASFIYAYLAKDLCEFEEEHPELMVELQQNDRFFDPVQKGYDIRLQIYQDHISTLDKTDIVTIRKLMVATPAYIKKYGQPSTPEDLSQHRIAHNNYIDPQCCYNIVRTDGVYSLKVNPRMLSNTIQMIHAAVMSGRYMALMPVHFIKEEIINGTFVPLMPNIQINSEQLSAYYRRSSFVPMKVRIFINFLRRKYGDNCPPWEKRLLENRPELSTALGAD